MNGYLLVDKPVGMSSYDVIRHIKSLLRTTYSTLPRIGHAGTLDPLATGLLIVLFGSATKQADRFLKLDKEYMAQITLGAISQTDDAEGPIRNVDCSQKTVDSLDQKKIETVSGKFIGEIEQVPPAHSAIQVGGQRAYALARQGKIVDLASRKVTIYDLKLISYRYPVLKVRAKVSSGTYIRSLARDIGEALGIGAYLSGLRRTEIDQWKVDQSAKLNQLTAESLPLLIKTLGE